MPTATATATDTPILLPTPDGVSRAIIMPILMYHYISDPPSGAGTLRRDLSVSPEAFRAQLAYFQQAGYTSITLRDLVMHLTVGEPLPPKPIILTFDDGYEDAYTNAFPILREYGFTGTFFVITGFADEGRSGYLTWDEIMEMSSGGMEIGAHSYTHPDLAGQSIDYIVWQSLGPKEAVESRTGIPVISFCYPFGSYDDQVIAVVRSANYWAGVTTEQGMLHTSDSVFRLTRVRVRGTDDVAHLALSIQYLTNVAIADLTATPRAEATPIPTAAPTRPEPE